MIHKIYASDHRFKTVEFQTGLNVILADKKHESGKKDSRNGLGKTSLINIMHFCFGADLNKKLLPIDQIEDWTFFIEFDLLQEKIIASRSIKNPSEIKVQGNVSVFPIAAEKDQLGHCYSYKNTEWKKLLGICFFDLPAAFDKKYVPTFRNLISYFLRSGIDAYSLPFSYFRGQPAWSTQAHSAYLLGLNWEHASTAQEIKDKSTAVKSLNAAVKLAIIPSQGDLEAERVRLQIELDHEKIALAEFKVHHQYYQIQEEANLLTQIIHDLTNKILVLRRKLERYEASIQSEQAPDLSSVELLYKEAGLHFGEALKKTLADAKTFHSKIVQNRANFLQVEIEQIKNQITINNNNIEISTNKRADLMIILQTHGALEEFSFLQERLSEKKAKLENIKLKIIDLQQISVQKTQIKAEKIELEKKLQRDYEQSRIEREKAVIGFNENSKSLYNEPGNLIINISENGYSFNVEIPRSNSEGVGKMKIFCYDLMLVDLWSKQNKINFLVHDSTIFDGVDSRQIAHALERAHENALKSNFQYICAFNSDMLPEKDFSTGFNIHHFVRLTLNDQDPKDSLMGFRFNEC